MNGRDWCGGVQWGPFGSRKKGRAVPLGATLLFSGSTRVSKMFQRLTAPQRQSNRRRCILWPNARARGKCRVETGEGGREGGVERVREGGVQTPFIKRK